MAFLNIPVENEALGWKISETLFELSRPEIIKNPGDVSNFYCNVEKNPRNGFWYLRIPVSDRFPMHSKTEVTAMDEVLNPFIQGKVITVADLDVIRNGIKNNQGKFTNIEAYIPKFWIDSSVPDSDFINNNSLENALKKLL